MRRWRGRRAGRQKELAELNVTAFLNLMVVLVPFLLVMAVFSRITILQLNLPGSQQAGEVEAPALDLEVIVRKDRIEVGGREAGILMRLENGPGGYDLEGLSERLQKVKRQFPAKTEATILLEPDIAYEHVVAVMDTVRVVRSRDGTEIVSSALFPDISIGDAPLTGAGGQG